MAETNYKKLEKPLNELKEQYESYSTLYEQGLSEVNQRAVKNSVIKCFEICYDTLWKHIRRNLEDEQLLVDVPNSPKPLFRLAHESGLIDKDLLERLFDYAQTRVDTSHDYSMEKAENALSKIDNFIQDATEIYQTMITWE